MTTIDELERLLALAKAQEQLQSGGAGQAIELSVAIETFILDCRAGQLSEATVRWYDSLLKTLANAFVGRTLATITTNDLRGYLVALQRRQTRFQGASQRREQPGELSAQTIAGHSASMHVFWAWAAREYHISNPMATVKRPKRQKAEPKAIADADFIALLDSCEDDEAGYRNRALLAFLADTGARVGELCSLTKANLLLQQKQAIVSGKTGTRIVVYTNYTRALLALWLSTRTLDSSHVFTSLTTGSGLTTSGVEQVLRRLKKAAGVNGQVNPHRFRGAFARNYILAGGNVIRLAQLMGHRNVNTTAAYYAIFSAEELAEMHEDFSPLKRMMEAK